MKVALILIMCFLAYFSVGFGLAILLILTGVLDPDDPDDEGIMTATVLFWPIVTIIIMAWLITVGMGMVMVKIGRKIKENKRNGSD